MLHVCLSEKDFRELINGRAICKDVEDQHQRCKVAIALSDIGLGKMMEALAQEVARVALTQEATSVPDYEGK